MDIKIHVKSSRSQAIVSNLTCGLSGLKAMTLFFFATLPLSFLFTLCAFPQAIDEGKYIHLVLWAIGLNVIWLLVQMLKNEDEFFTPFKQPISFPFHQEKVTRQEKVTFANISLTFIFLDDGYKNGRGKDY